MFPRQLEPALALEGARPFTVTSPTRIEVPGCTFVHRVFVDGAEMPVEEDRMFAVEKKGKEPEMVPHTVPLCSLEHVEGHGTCLVRSLYSNDGLWQVGSTVVVVGEWDSDAEETFVSSRLVEQDLAARDARIAELEAQIAQNEDGGTVQSKTEEKPAPAKKGESKPAPAKKGE